MEKLKCPNCKEDFSVLLGDFSFRYDEDAEMWVLREVNIHGSIELSRGDTKPEALRAAADEIEG
jgi:hypothetical protein